MNHRLCMCVFIYHPSECVVKSIPLHSTNVDEIMTTSKVVVLKARLASRLHNRRC